MAKHRPPKPAPELSSAEREQQLSSDEQEQIEEQQIFELPTREALSVVPLVPVPVPGAPVVAPEPPADPDVPPP
jgi:hypothetical protein